MIDLFSRANIQIHARVKYFPNFDSRVPLFAMMNCKKSIVIFTLHTVLYSRFFLIFNSLSFFFNAYLNVCFFVRHYASVSSDVHYSLTKKRLYQQTHLKQIKGIYVKKLSFNQEVVYRDGIPSEIAWSFCILLKGRYLFKGFLVRQYRLLGS